MSSSTAATESDAALVPRPTSHDGLAEQEQPSLTPLTWTRPTDMLALLLLAVLTGVGLWYRFSQIELKPLHHDEGVNGWFIMRLLNEGKYTYNPKNYHGPLLYVLSTLPVWILGLKDVALRCMPALFGALAVPGMLLFRRPLGWLGVLLAAAYVAIAPIEVYFSRTAIHEIYNFTFNVFFVGALLAWTYAPRQWLLTLGLCALVCLFGTKETTIITLAAVGPALLLAVLFGKGPLPSPGMAVEVHGPVGFVLSGFWYLAAVLMNNKEQLRKAAVVAVALWAFLFSYWLSPHGLLFFFAAFFAWGDTGVEGKGHQKIWYYFITHLLWPYYRPLVIWGLAGMIWATARQRRLGIFTLTWFVLATAAYSVIPYKTPWCVLSFSTPLFLGVGMLAQETLQSFKPAGSWMGRVLGSVTLLAATASIVPFAVPMGPEYNALIQPYAIREEKTPARELARTFLPPMDSWTINFEEFDVKGHPFIYVQNVREYLDLVHDLEGLIQTAQLGGDEKEPTILLLDAKNPMRWYLRKTGTQHWPKKLEAEPKKKIEAGAEVIVVSKEVANDAKAFMKGRDYINRRYHERPGRKIDLYVKRELWDAYVAAAQAGKVSPPPSPTPAEKSFSDRRTPEMKEYWSRKAMN